MNFAIIERDYIRSNILPDFDWVTYLAPSRINPLRKTLSQARVAIVTTAGVHAASDPAFNLLSRTGDPPIARFRTTSPGNNHRHF